MKICIIGDMHFAYKSSNQRLCKIHGDNLYKFIEDVLFPYLKENNITTIIQTGDLYDSRIANSNIAVAESINRFFNRITDINFHTIVGNHDIFYLNSNVPNAQQTYLEDFDNVHVYSSTKTVNINGIDIDMVPWINKENEQEILEFISKSNSKVCVCHPEISGFKMNKDSFCQHGLDRNIFSKYSLVIAGHFHEKSQAGNITYVGTPNQHNWGDVDSIRGFHVLDTETLELEFIPNPHNLFVRFEYVDGMEAKDLQVEGKYVKIILPVDYDDNKYRLFLSDLYEQMPLEILGIETIVDKESDIQISSEEVESGTFDLQKFLVEHSKSISDEYEEEIYNDIYRRLFEEI